MTDHQSDPLPQSKSTTAPPPAKPRRKHRPSVRARKAKAQRGMIRIDAGAAWLPQVSMYAGRW